MTSTPLLAVSGLVKSYGARLVLDHIDLEVAPGEILGLLGPNGAGKTTLLSIVSGLVRPDEGEVMVAGFDAVAEPQRVRPLLGVAPQETGVYPTLTCRQNLRFFAELAGLHGVQLRDAIEQVADALALIDLLDRRAGELSGGERRRLHSAIALTHRPPLVLLDEPTTGADVRTRSQLLELVQSVAAAGSAVVYSTHYLTEIEQLSASVVILDRGRVVTRGDVDVLVAAHGASVVEMTFRGPAPSLVSPPDATIEIEGSFVRIRSAHPGQAAALVLEQLGTSVGELRSFEIVTPSLETVFLELTGRRYGPTDEELTHVA
jgi:ABC-2 type transport system ATP-binding protein